MGPPRSRLHLPELEPILNETLGVMVYQEQVMQIANVLGGYSLGGADLLRRAMGKKDADEMAKQREIFLQRRCRAQVPQSSRRRNLRPDGAVRRLRLQQVALRRLRAPRLSHRLAQDALPGRVHGRAAHLGNIEARKRRQVYRRVQRDQHRRRPTRRASLRRQLHPQGDSIVFGLAAIKNVGHNAIESIIAARNELQAAGKQGFQPLGVLRTRSTSAS